MTLQELMNADVRAIGGLVRQGFAWWIDELAALLPAGWRGLFSFRPKVLAEPLSAGGWRYWRDGRPIAAEGLAARAARKWAFCCRPARC